MGNTAAVSSSSCCRENNAHSPSIPRSANFTTFENSKENEHFLNKFSLRRLNAHYKKPVTRNGNQNHSANMNNHSKNESYDRKGYSMPVGFNLYRGIDFVKNGHLNKGLTFSIEERQKLGILGLVPPAVKTDEEEIARCKANLDRLTDNLDKYVYLVTLQEANEKLFYKLLASDVKGYMPLVYTPIVGLACQNFSLIFQKPPRGLYITIYDKGYVYEVLRNWPEQDVRAIVVTDGERILGLGDLGANGMGIPNGKLSLYTALAGVKPYQCLPITLDVGCNTESILQDPFYIGLRQKRVTGEQYDEFLDEFMHACVRRFGRNVLIQFEDFGNHNAFKLLAKYRDSFCTFNDDIQGTACVALAGLLASQRITGTRLSDNTITFLGAGEAAIGIANLCVMAMQNEGTSQSDARDKIFLIDSKGLVVNDRPEGGVEGHKKDFAKHMPPIRALLDAIEAIKPSILIGASAVRGAFTSEILSAMARINKRPVIFALSNPTDKAECTAEEAYTHTDGNAIFASGSPFDPVNYRGKTFHPGQGNNSYVFPGIALAAVCAGIKIIDEEVFFVAAQALANQVTNSDLEIGSLYPPLINIRECSLKIAIDVINKAYQSDVASTYPEPEDKDHFIRCQMYDASTEPMLPPEYNYPKL